MRHPDYIKWFKRGALSLMATNKTTQAWVSKQSGLSQAQVNRIVSGHDAGSEDARRAIAEALGTTYEEILRLGKLLESKGAQNKNAKDPTLSIVNNNIKLFVVDPPSWEQSALNEKEKNLLEDALAVLRSPDCGSFARVLEDNILSFRDAIELAGRPRGNQKSRRSGRTGGR